MNCPSRTDNTLLHSSWNQSPCHLTADLTTRQDLNGVVNSRDRRDGIDPVGLDRSDVGTQLDAPDPGSSVAGYGSMGLAQTKQANCISQGQNHVFPPNAQRSDESFDNCPSTATIGRFTSTAFFVIMGGGIYYLTQLVTGSLSRPDESNRTSFAAAALSKRAAPAPCGRGRPLVGYNVPWHVGALFIVLFVSGSACAFPLIVIRFPRLRIPSSFLFLARHFGTGVLLATAFAHLLPTAFLSLTDACLPPFWNNDYPAMAGVMALAAVFLVAIIEMVFRPHPPLCAEASGVAVGAKERSSLVSGGHVGPSTDVEATAATACVATRSANATPGNQTKGLIRNLGPLNGRSNSLSRGLVRIGQESDRLDRIEVGQLGGTPMDRCESDSEKRLYACAEMLQVTPRQKHQKAVLQCMLLEMGILFHSVFIGMALSVSVGKEFYVLLIAITFHQTFEGLALGSRIATLDWHAGALQPWIMALAYGCTTPIGQAIGLATHTLYDPNSEVGLLMVGIMNAISSGLLIYASLVELMSEDFLSDESWRVLRGKRRVFACILVFLGAAGMSLVGAWA